MKNLRAACAIFFVVTGLLLPMGVCADGVFVVPKWNKSKDINEPTQKTIIVYDGGLEDLILQVKYDGPVEQFGWLIPVPGLPKVMEGSMESFYELSRYTQALWEPRVPEGRGGPAPEPVKVAEVKAVGAYQVAVLSAQDGKVLEDWLSANDFSFPREQADVIDGYAKQGWYFVAAKIDLSKERGFALIPASSGANTKERIAKKLSSGELHPLHLSFATDKCVFPLKISSMNGKESEVQVYVLSREPLLERGMLERALPGIYADDVERARNRAFGFERRTLISERLAFGSTNLHLSAEDEGEAERMRYTIRPSGALPHYARVTKKDLPVCSGEISGLGHGAWWLTKRTWTFEPEEMRDLEFQPAVPALADKLDSKYGYYVAGYLLQFGSNAVPAVLAALQSGSTSARAAIISGFENFSYPYTAEISRDSKFKDGLRKLSRDPDPKMREFVLQEAAASPEEFWAGMHDEDFQVAITGVERLGDYLSRDEGKKYVPALMKMLESTNANTRAVALFALLAAHATLPREDLLGFFNSTNIHVVGNVFDRLEGQGGGVSNDEALPLLRNPNSRVRLIGLQILYKNGQKSSVEFALPLLKDPDGRVALRAAATLRALTGQHFTKQQAHEWQKWWDTNETNFTVQLHPDEIWPRHKGTNWMKFVRAATRLLPEYPEEQ